MGLFDNIDYFYLRGNISLKGQMPAKRELQREVEIKKMDIWKIEREISRREFMKKSGFWALGIGVLGAGGYTYFMEPRAVRIERIDICLRGLPPRWKGRRVIQLSDIHCSQVVSRDYLVAVMEAVNREKPDTLVLTGDYITGGPGYIEDLKHVLSKLNPTLTKDYRLAVLGNHDWWNDPVLVTKTLEDAGFDVLLNRGVELDELFWGGLGDMWCGSPDLKTTLSRWDKKSGPGILLSHNPDILPDASKSGIDFIMAGHTHGGQVKLPLVGGVITPSRLGYFSGFYRQGSTTMYINRGVGMTKPPVRFGCPPEITVYTLHNDDGGHKGVQGQKKKYP